MSKTIHPPHGPATVPSHKPAPRKPRAARPADLRARRRAAVPALPEELVEAELAAEHEMTLPLEEPEEIAPIESPMDPSHDA